MESDFIFFRAKFNASKSEICCIRVFNVRSCFEQSNTFFSYFLINLIGIAFPHSQPFRYCQNCRLTKKAPTVNERADLAYVVFASLLSFEAVLLETASLKRHVR
jgi:hypothetical protein